MNHSFSALHYPYPPGNQLYAPQPMYPGGYPPIQSPSHSYSDLIQAELYYRQHYYATYQVWRWYNRANYSTSVNVRLSYSFRVSLLWMLSFLFYDTYFLNVGICLMSVLLSVMLLSSRFYMYLLNINKYISIDV